MMASPVDLTDFAYGFALSERLIDGPDDVVAVDRHTTELGEILRLTLIPERAERIVERVRHRVSESSCGLVGLENQEQAVRRSGERRVGEECVSTWIEWGSPYS